MKYRLKIWDLAKLLFVCKFISNFKRLLQERQLDEIAEGDVDNMAVEFDDADMMAVEFDDVDEAIGDEELEDFVEVEDPL